MGKDVTVDGVTGTLTHFIVEPFLPHAASDEYYVCITSHRTGEDILFHHEVCQRLSSCPPITFAY